MEAKLIKTPEQLYMLEFYNDKNMLACATASLSKQNCDDLFLGAHDTEIEVEIERQCLDPNCDGVNRKGCCIPGDKPKLDSEGCLIIKKK